MVATHRLSASCVTTMLSIIPSNPFGEYTTCEKRTVTLAIRNQKVGEHRRTDRRSARGAQRAPAAIGVEASCPTSGAA